MSGAGRDSLARQWPRMPNSRTPALWIRSPSWSWNSSYVRSRQKCPSPQQRCPRSREAEPLGVGKPERKADVPPQGASAHARVPESVKKKPHSDRRLRRYIRNRCWLLLVEGTHDRAGPPANLPAVFQLRLSFEFWVFPRTKRQRFFEQPQAAQADLFGNADLSDDSFSFAYQHQSILRRDESRASLA